MRKKENVPVVQENRMTDRVHIAITRGVSSGMARCELAHLERETIDIATARSQHLRYEQALRDLGCRIETQPSAADLPDSVFVEDTAVVLDEIAVIARPGAESRRRETDVIRTALRPYRTLEELESPATLDGGDVLCVGRTVFVGVSRRTNRTGFDRIRALLEPRGYEVREVPVTRCLHLKSAVTRIGERKLLVNSTWLDSEYLRGYELVPVDPDEPFGANALLIGNTVICSSLYPRTRDRLVKDGVRIVELDVSELAKAEGGVTCCSIVFEAEGGNIDA
jgi:dimethylargininase